MAPGNSTIMNGDDLAISSAKGASGAVMASYPNDTVTSRLYFDDTAKFIFRSEPILSVQCDVLKDISLFF